MKTKLNIENMGCYVRITLQSGQDSIAYNQFANLAWSVGDGKRRLENDSFICEKERLIESIKSFREANPVTWSNRRKGGYWKASPFEFFVVRHFANNGTDLSILEPYKQGQFDDFNNDVWHGHKSRVEKLFDKVA